MCHLHQRQKNTCSYASTEILCALRFRGQRISQKHTFRALHILFLFARHSRHYLVDTDGRDFRSSLTSVQNYFRAGFKQLSLAKQNCLHRRWHSDHRAGATEADVIANHNTNLRGLLNWFDKRASKWTERNYSGTNQQQDGHELTKLKVRPDKQKVAAIQYIPLPSDQQGVLRLQYPWQNSALISMSAPNPETLLLFLLLEAAWTICPFASCPASTTPPPFLLLKAENAFCWRPNTHGETLQKLKHMLMEAPVLTFFNTNKPKSSSATQVKRVC